MEEWKDPKVRGMKGGVVEESAKRKKKGAGGINEDGWGAGGEAQGLQNLMVSEVEMFFSF